VKLRTGTSGFSYKQWKGSFYPEDLPSTRWLDYYAQQLPAVEINNTFYRMPKTSVLEGWAAQVPADFRFSIKASRRITHFKRLKDAGDETSYLLGQLESLGDRLGVVLFQLPPNLKRDVPRLEAFLDLLPDNTPAAFEFRHESWLDDDVLDCLRARKAALCIAETDELVAPELVATAPIGYLRLRRSAYTDADMATWQGRLRASGWRDAYVFLKHEDAGVGPRLAGTLLALDASRAPRAVRRASQADESKTG
jgi:uncharacterized protein YecE (DUF72 family)